MAQGGTGEAFDCLLAKVSKLLLTLDLGTDVNVSDLHEPEFYTDGVCMESSNVGDFLTHMCAVRWTNLATVKLFSCTC